jgi:hypothetical protein
VAVDRPIFILGTGRCGSSLLLRLLGYHPDLAWLSHFTSYLPGGGRWGSLARIHDVPGLERLLVSRRSRLIPQPTENYRLLNEATDWVFTRPGLLTADDVTPEARTNLHALVEAHQEATGRSRFVLKYTGFPRMAYLREVFPDARFIHVVRDGRAVAASLCAVDWWSGEGHWGWGKLTDAQVAAYVDSGYHELVLTALYWEVLMGHLTRASAEMSDDQLMVVRYDHLVADHRGTLDQIADFAGLPPDATFRSRVAATPMTSDDTRWRRTLAPDEQAIVSELLGDTLRQYGFEA